MFEIIELWYRLCETHLWNQFVWTVGELTLWTHVFFVIFWGPPWVCWNSFFEKRNQGKSHKIFLKLDLVVLEKTENCQTLVYTYKLVLISTNAISSNLSMKEGSLFVLFCTDEIHRIGMLQITFLVLLESSQGEGCMGLVS